MVPGRIFILISIFCCLQCGARTDLSSGAVADADSDVDTTSSPNVTCDPEEVWTTIDRRAVIYGNGTDEGWITSWHWEITDRPVGSVVDLVPSDSQITSLTPDSEGDYVVELTATDNDSQTSTCSSVIHSIVGPPVAFCPEDIEGAQPGRSYLIEGDGFDDVMILSFRWEISEKPLESLTFLESPTEPVVNFVPDIEGTFELLLTVTDNEGLTGTCTVNVFSNGPPTAICPDQATVPTRQPHTLYGNAEDDGEISVWTWEIISSPDNSNPDLASRSSQDAVLTPDRVGGYNLRLTVTDDQGLTDSCEATVVATPTGPDAICPETITTTPLTEVTILGDGADDGEIVSFRWEMVEIPLSSSTPGPEPADRQQTTLFADVAGDYLIRLTVVDDDGMEDSCETAVQAIPGEGLRVELFWNPPNNGCDDHDYPCDPSDVDLHLLHPEAPYWFDSTPGRSDCYYSNCTRGLEWDDPGPADNPRLDIDDREGFGPENINIDEPVIGHSYTVGVHYYSDDGSGPAYAYVRIYCGTIDIDPVYDGGPVRIVGDSAPDDNDFWRVATVEWDGVSCTVTPLTGADGGPDIVTASATYTAR